MSDVESQFERWHENMLTLHENIQAHQNGIQSAASKLSIGFKELNMLMDSQPALHRISTERRTREHSAAKLQQQIELSSMKITADQLHTMAYKLNRNLAQNDSQPSINVVDASLSVAEDDVLDKVINAPPSKGLQQQSSSSRSQASYQKQSLDDLLFEPSEAEKALMKLLE
ncbi:hypothetical protein MIR68_007906 [Amoeboaphelidium protococcarum]|nr:hypothetical protein MIR68_007906 [Amoeboaphelidium protococcarum]